MMQLLNEKDELVVMASKCLSLTETVQLPRKKGRLRAVFVVRMRGSVLNISGWIRQQGKQSKYIACS